MNATAISFHPWKTPINDIRQMILFVGKDKIKINDNGSGYDLLIGDNLIASKLDAYSLCYQLNILDVKRS